MARFQWIIELGILVFLADHGLEWLLLGGLLIAVRESIVRLINFRSEQTESELKDMNKEQFVEALESFVQPSEPIAEDLFMLRSTARSILDGRK